MLHKNWTSLVLLLVAAATLSGCISSYGYGGRPGYYGGGYTTYTRAPIYRPAPSGGGWHGMSGGGWGHGWGGGVRGGGCRH